jgi:hypothetical protein
MTYRVVSPRLVAPIATTPSAEVAHRRVRPNSTLFAAPHYFGIYGMHTLAPRQDAGMFSTNEQLPP